MQHQTIVPIPGRLVSGLGVCDAWRLELSAPQLPWLAEELENACGRLDEKLATSREVHASDPSDDTAERVRTLEYERQLVGSMRAQLPRGASTTWSRSSIRRIS